MKDVMKIGAGRLRPRSNALGMLGMSALVFVLATAVNCFGSSPQPVYYALEGTGEVTSRAVKWPHSLVVTRFTVRAPYDRPELVYRKEGRELRFYPFDLWAGKPGRMMAEAVTEHLRSAGLFKDVTMSTVAGEADFELRGEVVTIVDLDLAEKDWRAHLETRFEPFEYGVLGQIAPDEHDFAGRLFVLAPGFADVRSHEHVHALEDHAPVGPVHEKHAFIPEHVWPVNLSQSAHIFL